MHQEKRSTKGSVFCALVLTKGSKTDPILLQSKHFQEKCAHPTLWPPASGFKNHFLKFLTCKTCKRGFLCLERNPRLWLDSWQSLETFTKIISVTPISGNRAGIFKKSMGARNWGGIGLSYRPAGFIGWRVINWRLFVKSPLYINWELRLVVPSFQYFYLI